MRRFVHENASWLVPVSEGAKQLSSFLPSRFTTTGSSAELLHTLVNLFSLSIDSALFRSRVVSSELYYGPGRLEVCCSQSSSSAKALNWIQRILRLVTTVQSLCDLQAIRLARVAGSEHITANNFNRFASFGLEITSQSRVLPWEDQDSSHPLHPDHPRWRVILMIETIKAVCRCVFLLVHRRPLRNLTESELQSESLLKQQMFESGKSAQSKSVPSIMWSDLIQSYIACGRSAQRNSPSITAIERINNSEQKQLLPRSPPCSAIVLAAEFISTLSPVCYGLPPIRLYQSLILLYFFGGKLFALSFFSDSVPASSTVARPCHVHIP